MPSLTLSFSFTLSAILLVAFLASPTAAFGAGNIASIARIEGVNWRHGDIEDTLLNILMSRAAGGKKFTKLDVKRVYFGNWLRDYSQAVDVGSVKYVSAEAIRIIVWVLGFMSFGYGTREFEVTMNRLGCYRPEEHIDNPKDYADNIDARKYDRRLRGPVDERKELSINPQTGLKNYIATENIGIATSSGMVRAVFGRCIQIGRLYAKTRRREDLFEALRLLGTGCHCLEDYAAHSNYMELALIELGERGVFPYVGRKTMMKLPGPPQPVFPIVTGTFGGVDFLYSVMGEFSDKATQSEIQELQGTMQNSGRSNVSLLQTLLKQAPSGVFGGKDQAGKASELQANATAVQMQNTHISPRQPEAWTRYLQTVQREILPILQWHDEIMQSITQALEDFPNIIALVEKIQDQLNIFVFSLLAPLVVPIINQVKTELNTGTQEVIQSSKAKQFIVFRNDMSTDPTHSMLAKDHFSNVLNEPAGKVASQVVRWVVPQLMACWDDDRIDVNRTLTRIVNGVFHHPALRNVGNDGAVDCRRQMFGVVQQWWGSKPEPQRQILRGQLSREGVEQGKNHLAGVRDTGHGCCRPLTMPTVKTAQSSGVGGIAIGLAGGLVGGAALAEVGSALKGQSKYDPGYTGKSHGSSMGSPPPGGIGQAGGLAAGAAAAAGMAATAGISSGGTGPSRGNPMGPPPPGIPYMGPPPPGAPYGAPPMGPQYPGVQPMGAPPAAAPPPDKKGMSGLGAGALGAVGGLALGGALLEAKHAYDKHEYNKFEEESEYRHGGYGGYSEGVGRPGYGGGYGGTTVIEEGGSSRPTYVENNETIIESGGGGYARDGNVYESQTNVIDVGGFGGGGADVYDSSTTVVDQGGYGGGDFYASQTTDVVDTGGYGSTDVYESSTNVVDTGGYGGTDVYESSSTAIDVGGYGGDSGYSYESQTTEVDTGGYGGDGGYSYDSQTTNVETGGYGGDSGYSYDSQTTEVDTGGYGGDGGYSYDQSTTDVVDQGGDGGYSYEQQTTTDSYGGDGGGGGYSYDQSTTDVVDQGGDGGYSYEQQTTTDSYGGDGVDGGVYESQTTDETSYAGDGGDGGNGGYSYDQTDTTDVSYGGDGGDGY